MSMLIVALALTGGVVVYLCSRYLLKHRRAALLHSRQEQADGILAKARLQELARYTAQPAPPFPAPMSTQDESEGANIVSPRIASSDSIIDVTENISPEILALIAEVIAASLGEKVRIRSAKKIAPSLSPTSMETPFPIDERWIEEGRALLHASHEIVQTRIHAELASQAATSLRGVALETTDRD